MLQLQVHLRDAQKKPAQYRKEGQLPGVLYGGSENFSLFMDKKLFKKALQEAGYSSLIQIQSEKFTKMALIKSFQIHPLTDDFIHFDMMEVEENKVVRVQVPVVLDGVAKGVREGGILELIRDHLQVQCKAKDIPRAIHISIDHLNIGDNYHVSDLPAVEHIQYMDPDNTTIVTVVGEVEQSIESSIENPEQESED